MAEDGNQYALPSAKKHARTVLTPELMRAIKKIESGGNPNARTGKYKGAFQLSDEEFKKRGGRGDIFNEKENERVAALKLQEEADQVAKKLGRPLTPGEVYLVHQQGVGGATAHLTNPDQPAWRSMHSTGEGKSKGEGWSRLAIWGNVPDKDKARYGSVDNLTSGEFTKMWADRIARGGGGASPAAAPAPLDPTPNVGAGESTYAAQAQAEADKKLVDPTPNVGSGASGYDATSSPAEVATGASTLGKGIGEKTGDAFADLANLFANGPVAKNAARPSGPANLPVPTTPMPSGTFPTVDPRAAEMQRQQLALAMQRLNSGKIV